MTVFRRGVLAAACALFAAFAPVAQAQDYPTRTISLVVPWPAGGLVDAVARVVGEKLSATLGRPVIVENKPGAAGKLGTQPVARAQPDCPSTP